MTSPVAPTAPLAAPPQAAPPAQPVVATGEETEADAEIKEGAVAATTEEAPKVAVTVQQEKKKAGPDVDKETHRFRELLLFGRKKVSV